MFGNFKTWLGVSVFGQEDEVNTEGRRACLELEESRLSAQWVFDLAELRLEFEIVVIAWETNGV
jgi:hypothetical protein